MFDTLYSPTDLGANLQSAFEGRLANPPSVGAYNNGLLSIVDRDSSNQLLRSWTHVVDLDSVSLVTTGFGDVFFLDSQGVNFLEVQRGTKQFIDSDIAWFLNSFLSIADVVENVFRRKQFDQLVDKKGPLTYSQVFILEPWLMLGGSDRVENYNKGECSVYLDLVGKAFQMKTH